jgi:hypothetical protein
VDKNFDNKKVEITEAISIRVGLSLKKMGYILADDDGWPMDGLGERSGIGVIAPNATAINTEESFLIFFKKTVKKAKRIFLGYISFLDQSNNGIWQFKAYGRSNLEKIKEICERLSAEFNVNISIYLADEYVRHEYISSW